MGIDRTAPTPITDTDLSVVVQGPATATLPAVVASVRNWLPGAELIVSTWQGAAVDGLDADRLLLNEDPGSTPYLDAGGRRTAKSFNTNRMLRSTQAGLAVATRPYALKVRNDTPLRSAAVLDRLGDEPRPRAAATRVFEQRIVMPNIAVRPSNPMSGYLFHPSDIVHAGLRADLLRLWDVDLIDERENAEWFLARPRPVPDDMPYSWCRYYNEQVLWLGCLRKHGIDPGYEHAGHDTPELRAASDRSIANNFVCVEPWQLGITLPFEEITRVCPTWQYVWHHQWLRSVEQLTSA